MTENQALDKWCPFARTVLDRVEVKVSVNRSDDDGLAHPDCYCLGSRCMAWRWINDLPGDRRGGECGIASRLVAVISD